MGPGKQIFPKLLDRPVRCRILGHVPVKDPSRPDVEDHERMEDAEVEPPGQQDERDARGGVRSQRPGRSLLVERQPFPEEQVLSRQLPPGGQSQPDQGEEVTPETTDGAKQGRPTAGHSPVS